MNDEMDDFGEGPGRQEILCPRCHKPHYSSRPIMDEYIDCDCGFRFYAFSCQDLKITMLPEEASYEPVVRNLRRFVVSTGRCTDIPQHLYQDEDGQYCFDIGLRNEDADEVLERALESFQLETFGESFLTVDLIGSICESFLDGNDVELRKQKDRVDIIKLIKKKVSITEKRRKGQRREKEAPHSKTMAQISMIQCDYGILRNGQSQEKRIGQ